MNIICESFDELAKRIKKNNYKIVMFGAGAIGTVSFPEILRDKNLLKYVDCYLDNDETKWGTVIRLYGEDYEIKSPDCLSDYDNTVIMLNISRFPEVLSQLENMDYTSRMICYITPMLLIHNYCSQKSSGSACMTKSPLIPKKLHYMWLGRGEKPAVLQQCIESWKKYCPDYEIIEWNEDNYDLDKHIYMRQAYDVRAFGFVPDYARLDILYNEGGLYLDTDVEIKRNLDELLYQEAFCGVEKWQIINFGGLSGSVKKHPMIKEFLEARKDICFIEKNGKQNRVTCGYYDTLTALRNGYKISGNTQSVNRMNIYSFDYFHPYDYMSGTLFETDNTYSVHWFNGGWLDEKMKLANDEARNTYMKIYQGSLKEPIKF